MNALQLLLRPIAKIGMWHAGKQLRRFLAAHAASRRVQDELLASLVHLHRDTSFGRDHGFDRIHNYEDFKKAVPVGRYEDRREYVTRVLEGDFGALLPGAEPPLMFSMTSGTTGEPKYIPVTRAFLADLRRGWNIFGLNVLSRNPGAIMRYILQISSSTKEESSPTGLPCGAISGLLASAQKRIVRRMYVAPLWTGELDDPDDRFYTLARYAAVKDVAFITTANPSSTIKLVETMQRYCDRLLRDIRDGTFRPPGGHIPAGARTSRFKPNPALAGRLEGLVKTDGCLLPKHVWNLTFLTNWTGGTLRLYLKRLRELFGHLPIFDIGLLASEGRFSIPLEEGTAAGVAEITSNFLEFIPVGERDATDPPVLRSHELETGEEYFLVFSNNTGLFRYNIDDRIRVTGFRGQTPLFEFCARGVYTSSITGEKITEAQVVRAMESARAGAGIEHIDLFEMQGRFATPPHYELRVEISDMEKAQRLCELMDRTLRELNIEYDAKRKSRRLDGIQPVLLPPGTFSENEEQKIREKRGRTEQYKHQYLITDVQE